MDLEQTWYIVHVINIAKSFSCLICWDSGEVILWDRHKNFSSHLTLSLEKIKTLIVCMGHNDTDFFCRVFQ